MSQLHVNKNGGFMIATVLISLAAVCCVAVAGWYVWHQTHLPPAPAAQAAPRSAAKQSPVNPTAAGKYFVITEWNVRFPIDGSLKGDLKYVLRKNVDTSVAGQPSMPVDLAYFTAGSLESIPGPGNNCAIKPGAAAGTDDTYDPTSVSSGLGMVIMRSAHRLSPEWSTDKQVAGYWYRWDKGTAATCYAGSDGSKESAIRNGIIDGFVGLEATPGN